MGAALHHPFTAIGSQGQRRVAAGGDDIANGAVAMPAGAALGPAQRFRNRRQSESWSLACQMVPEESDIRQLLLALALGDVVVAGVAVGHFRGIGRI